MKKIRAPKGAWAFCRRKPSVNVAFKALLGKRMKSSKEL